MALVYQITEPEMNALFDRLKLVEAQRQDDPNLTPDERNRLAAVHRMFHMETVRWAQELGFKGYRG